MSSIIRFFSGLLPNFERDRIVEDIDQLRSEVRENLQPAFKQAIAVTAGKKIASKQLSEFNELFTLQVPEYRRIGYIAGMYDFYTKLDDKLDVIAKLIPEMFSKDVTKESITYRKASILQYVATVRFVNEYASRSLLRYLAAEHNMNVGKESEIDTQLAPAELKWLSDNMQAFLQAVKVLGIPVKDLQIAVGHIPEITVVPERFDVVAQTVGARNLDPFQFGLISGRWNPIYHLRSMWAEYRVECYKRDKEIKRALELRLLQLKQSNAGQQDARTTQMIEYTEGRIAKLHKAIEEMEQHA